MSSAPKPSPVWHGFRHGIGTTAVSIQSKEHSPDSEPAERPAVFVVTLEAKPGVPGVRALAYLLKLLGRYHGFKCLDVREGKRQRRR